MASAVAHSRYMGGFAAPDVGGCTHQMDVTARIICAFWLVDPASTGTKMDLSTFAARCGFCASAATNKERRRRNNRSAEPINAGPTHGETSWISEQELASTLTSVRRRHRSE